MRDAISKSGSVSAISIMAAPQKNINTPSAIIPIVFSMTHPSVQ